jgi:hypothetical protein
MPRSFSRAALIPNEPARILEPGGGPMRVYPEAKAKSDEFQAAAAQLGVRSIVLSAGTDADIDEDYN